VSYEEIWKKATKEVARERDQYKAERDTLIDDIAVLKVNISRLERENECEKEWFYKYSCELEHIVKHERDTIKRLERENEQKTKVINLYKKAYEKTHKGWFRYRELTNHIRDMKFASPYSYNYIHLVNFIKELERD
jgi:predicted RNase H-like nuclease (RuvC/YqgF family)